MKEVKQKWKLFANRNIAAASCYSLIPAITVLLFFTLFKPNTKIVTECLGVACLLLIVAILAAPQGSRLRFHAVQVSLLVLMIAAMMMTFAQNLSSGYAQNKHDVEGFGALVYDTTSLIVLCGCAILLFGLSFHLVAQAGRGRDIRLLAIGDLAAIVAGFTHKPTVDDFSGVQWGASPQEVRETISKQGFREETTKAASCITVKGSYAERQARLRFYFADQIFSRGSVIFGWEKGWKERLTAIHGLPKDELQLTDGLTRVTWRLSSGTGDKITVTADMSPTHTEKKATVTGSICVVYSNDRLAAHLRNPHENTL